MSQPLAVKTVGFETELTGRHVLGLVQSVVEQLTHSLCVDERYYDGDIYAIGQKSIYSYENIRVVPTLEDAYFRPDFGYRWVLVTSHKWEGIDYYGDEVDFNRVKEYVIGFADTLTTRALAAMRDFHYPEFTVPKGIELR